MADMKLSASDTEKKIEIKTEPSDAFDEFMSSLTLKIKKLKSQKPTLFELDGKSLRECPFCVGKSVYFEIDPSVPHKEETFFRIVCEICGAFTPWRDCRLNAVRLWQKREGLEKEGAWKMIECPYCLEENDEPEKYLEPGTYHLTECSHCKKEYRFQVDYDPVYYTSKVPCNDGEPHKWRFLYEHENKYRHYCFNCTKEEWRDEKVKND